MNKSNFRKNTYNLRIVGVFLCYDMYNNIDSKENEKI